MFDEKVKDTNFNNEKKTGTGALKPRALAQGESWKHVRSSQKHRMAENDPADDLHAPLHRRSSSTVSYQSPKPYFGRSSSKKLMTVALVSTEEAETHTFNFDEKYVKQYSQEADTGPGAADQKGM